MTPPKLDQVPCDLRTDLRYLNLHASRLKRSNLPARALGGCGVLLLLYTVVLLIVERAYDGVIWVLYLGLAIRTKTGSLQDFLRPLELAEWCCRHEHRTLKLAESTRVFDISVCAGAAVTGYLASSPTSNKSSRQFSFMSLLHST